MARFARLLALAYALGLAFVIQLVNTLRHDPLGAYYEEYAHGGSGKWRGADGQAFQLLLLAGLLGFPCAIYAAIAFFRRRERVPAAFSALALGWLVLLGFVRAALEMGG